jgi:hypothetical protein
VKSSSTASSDRAIRAGLVGGVSGRSRRGFDPVERRRRGSVDAGGRGPDPADRPLAGAEPLGDLVVGQPVAAEVDDSDLLGGPSFGELVEAVIGLDFLAGRGVVGGDLAGDVPLSLADVEALLAAEVVFLGPGPPAVLLVHLVAGNPRQEPAELPDIGEPGDFARIARQDARPDRLDDVHRVQLVPQDPGKPDADHCPDLRFEPTEEGRHGGLIAEPDILNQGGEVDVIQRRVLQKGGRGHAPFADSRTRRFRTTRRHSATLSSPERPPRIHPGRTVKKAAVRALL